MTQTVRPFGRVEGRGWLFGPGRDRISRAVFWISALVLAAAGVAAGSGGTWLTTTILMLIALALRGHGPAARPATPGGGHLPGRAPAPGPADADDDDRRVGRRGRHHGRGQHRRAHRGPRTRALAPGRMGGDRAARGRADPGARARRRTHPHRAAPRPPADSRGRRPRRPGDRPWWCRGPRSSRSTTTGPAAPRDGSETPSEGVHNWLSLELRAGPTPRTRWSRLAVLRHHPSMDPAGARGRPLRHARRAASLPRAPGDQGRARDRRRRREVRCPRDRARGGPAAGLTYS